MALLQRLPDRGLSDSRLATFHHPRSSNRLSFLGLGFDFVRLVVEHGLVGGLDNDLVGDLVDELQHQTRFSSFLKRQHLGQHPMQLGASSVAVPDVSSSLVASTRSFALSSLDGPGSVGWSSGCRTDQGRLCHVLPCSLGHSYILPTRRSNP